MHSEVILQSQYCQLGATDKSLGLLQSAIRQRAVTPQLFIPIIHRIGITYSCHLEISQHTPGLSTLYASIPDLRWAGIAMHLCKLELCLCARSRWEAHIADDVTKSLSDGNKSSAQYSQD